MPYRGNRTVLLKGLVLSHSTSCLYSPDCRELQFSETQFPLVSDSRKPKGMKKGRGCLSPARLHLSEEVPYSATECLS